MFAMTDWSMYMHTRANEWTSEKIVRVQEINDIPFMLLSALFLDLIHSILSVVVVVSLSFFIASNSIPYILIHIYIYTYGRTDGWMDGWTLDIYACIKVWMRGYYVIFWIRFTKYKSGIWKLCSSSKIILIENRKSSHCKIYSYIKVFDRYEFALGLIKN